MLCMLHVLACTPYVAVLDGLCCSAALRIAWWAVLQMWFGVHGMHVGDVAGVQCWRHALRTSRCRMAVSSSPLSSGLSSYLHVSLRCSVMKSMYLHRHRSRQGREVSVEARACELVRCMAKAGV
jgi:hypothetical protein